MTLTGRAGATLIELVVALVVACVGVLATASLTVTAARTVTKARALDEAHAVLRSFADSARAGGGPTEGTRELSLGTLEWNVPAAPGAAAWVRLEHRALAEPLTIWFAVEAGGAS